MKNVPSDPAAATTPTVRVRVSGGVARETVPMSTPKPVPAVPMPTRKPAICRPPAKRSATAISSRPAA